MSIRTRLSGRPDVSFADCPILQSESAIPDGVSLVVGILLCAVVHGWLGGVIGARLDRVRDLE